MSLQHGMIEPFVADQVRNGAISYGLSSYGYDMRIADEFKVFTNVFNTLVDPKHFDPRSFVDVKAEHCDIPPNSFVLARSVEYFRIPRRVLSVVLGKCLTGDTRVVDARSGAYRPIREMTSDGMTVGFTGARLRAVESYGVISQGIKPVFRLRLRSGREIRATANHPFLTGGGWIPLGELAPGTRIAAARTIPVFGTTPIPDWEAALLGLMIGEGQCFTPGRSPTFTSADPQMVDVLRSCVAEGLGSFVTYDAPYGYRIVNQVGRGGHVTKNRATAWLQSYGLDVKAYDKFVPQAIFTAPRESVVQFLQALFTGDGSVYARDRSICVEYASSSRRLIDDVHHLMLRFGISARIREKQLKKGRVAWTLTIHNKRQIQEFARAIGFWPGSIKQRTLESFSALLESIEDQRSKGDVLPGELWGFASQRLEGVSFRSVGVAETASSLRMTYPQATAPVAATQDAWLTQMSCPDLLWDVVESIAPAGDEEVFDICVPSVHNFVANGIVVHNSTYARCFSGDTRVALVDGTSMPIAELAEQWDRGVAHWGYSVGPHGRIIVTLLEQPRIIGRDSLLEVTLDNGRMIRCTPDHEFILRDGTLAQADALRPGASLMPLYTELFRGHEGIYQPLTGHYTPTHRLADDWNIRHAVYAEVAETHRHHIDHNRRNNAPWNIMRVPATEHISYHNQHFYHGPEFDAKEHGRSISAALERRATDPAWQQRYSVAQAERAHVFWSDPKYARVRERLVQQGVNYWGDSQNRDAQRERQHQYWADESRRQERALFSQSVWDRDTGARRAAQAEIARRINLREEITGEVVRKALDMAGSIRGAARLLNCDRAVFRRFPEVIAAFRGAPMRNHKVTAIRELAGTHDVYCLTVPEAGNFALEAGVFVRNCGLIVNVTPLEPEWQGYVTIEISNTTPLPARVYANEGIAQVLFLESDEDCLISYADKSGKYQNQVGVVPPRM